MNYRIGKFSELLGVTTDTLRFYEKRHIIQPMKDVKNHYRYFNDLDARPLLMSRYLRSLGISVEDVTALMSNPSIGEITEKIEESKENLQEKIDGYTRLFNKISEIKDELAGIDSAIGKFQIKKLPGIYRLQQTDKNRLIETSRTKESVANWMKALPFCFFCLKIDSNQFFTEGNYDYNWGLAVLENEMKHLHLTIDEKTEYICPQTYLSVTFKVSYEENSPLMGYRKHIFDYLQEKDYFVMNDIIGKLVFTQKINQEFFSYINVNIPIDFP